MQHFWWGFSFWRQYMLQFFFHLKLVYWVAPLISTSTLAHLLLKRNTLPEQDTCTFTTLNSKSLVTSLNWLVSKCVMAFGITVKVFVPLHILHVTWHIACSWFCWFWHYSEFLIVSTVGLGWVPGYPRLGTAVDQLLGYKFSIHYPNANYIMYK